MTAAIVYPYTGEPVPAHVLGYHGRSADDARVVRQGRSTLPQAQLWEREAERDEAARFDTLSDRWTTVVFPVWQAQLQRELRCNAASAEAAIQIGRGPTLADLDRRDRTD